MDHNKPLTKKALSDLEVRTEALLESALKILRLLFILIMVIYLLDCLISLSGKIVVLTIEHGMLDFVKMKTIVTLASVG